MTNHIPILRPLRTAEELQQLIEKANADKHLVLDPSHLMLKKGQVVGYFSLGETPLVNCWFSTQDISERDAVLLLLQALAAAAGKQPRKVIVPCPKESPFHALLTEERGFINVGTYDLFVKEV